MTGLHSSQDGSDIVADRRMEKLGFVCEDVTAQADIQAKGGFNASTSAMLARYLAQSPSAL